MTNNFGTVTGQGTRQALRVLLVCSLLAPAWIALAQERAQERSDVVETPAQAAPDVPAAPVAPRATARRSGFLEAVGRWVDESVNGMGKGFGDMWQGAARSSSDAAKASSEATSGLAKGAFDAAKGTADALGKIGPGRVVSGRERCVISSNGAPDCKIAAESLCKGKGFTSGSSVDYETTERCSAQALLRGRKESGDCKVEHIVTKAMCQ
jgi:hypothetical protein